MCEWNHNETEKEKKRGRQGREKKTEKTQQLIDMLPKTSVFSLNLLSIALGEWNKNVVYSIQCTKHLGRWWMRNKDGRQTDHTCWVSSAAAQRYNPYISVSNWSCMVSISNEYLPHLFVSVTMLNRIHGSSPVLEWVWRQKQTHTGKTDTFMDMDMVFCCLWFFSFLLKGSAQMCFVHHSPAEHGKIPKW